MDRLQKKELVAQLRGLFEENSLVVVSHYMGMTVAQTEQLRRKMREGGAGFRVTKNRLTRLALEGTKFQGLGDLFTGPTAMAFSVDPVAAAKAAVEFAKTNDKLVIVGGALGEKRLDPDGIRALAALPSLDQLRAQFVGLLGTPATRIAAILQAPGGQVARVLAAYAEKGEAA